MDDRKDKGCLNSLHRYNGNSTFQFEILSLNAFSLFIFLQKHSYSFSLIKHKLFSLAYIASSGYSLITYTIVACVMLDDQIWTVELALDTPTVSLPASHKLQICESWPTTFWAFINMNQSMRLSFIHNLRFRCLA